MSRFPFPIPTGWFQVGYSQELAVGDVVPLHYFGLDLVMFRAQEGRVSILDPFCPHLGAHLGHGGRLEEGKLVCPFHGWGFDREGRCIDVPYSEKMPKKAHLKAYTVVERNGLIMMWHDADGREPGWELPLIPEVEDDAWTDFKTRRWVIQSCNQEMAENAVDAAHFRYLHGTASYPVTTAEIEGHHLIVRSETHMTTPAGEVQGQIAVDCYGFGFTTTRFKGIVETMLIGCTTPIDGESCELWFSFMVKKFGGGEITKGIGRAAIREIERQLEQDIPVWENKRYLARPLLVAEDGPIGLFRSWARQFYPASAEASAAGS